MRLKNKYGDEIIIKDPNFGEAGDISVRIEFKLPNGGLDAIDMDPKDLQAYLKIHEYKKSGG